MSFYAVDPSTGKPFAELPETTAEEVAEMVQDGRRALAVEAEWREPAVRARILQALARRIEAEADALADLEARDTGRPLSRARRRAQAAVRALEAAAPPPTVTAPAGPDVLDYAVREPWGVCAVILSWRADAARHLAAGLAAGNAVILKPSALASIVALKLAELAAEAGVPLGMVQVATGDCGPALAARADHVTVAASTGAAVAVATACAGRLTPLHAEPPDRVDVVLADADLDRAVPAIARRGGRVLAERPQALRAPLADALAALTLGPALEDHDAGPVISERHRDRALAAGGESAGGLLVRPGLGEAAVGPLVSVEPLRAPGRQAVVTLWTADPTRAHRLDAAEVHVNAHADRAPAVPAYTRVKRIRAPLGR